jgi:hypothetical protein
MEISRLHLKSRVPHFGALLLFNEYVRIIQIEHLNTKLAHGACLFFTMQFLGLTLALFALASDRNPSHPIGGPRNVISIKSATDFCMFLPPLPNMTIAESEGYPFASDVEKERWAVSHCTKSNPDAPGHQYFYDEFIIGAHYRKTDQQVQITGRIDATKAALVMDGGGFYDLDANVNSPPGGMCEGYDSFYNAVNPIDGIFCIKCCKGMDCGIYNWQLGCAGMVPGDYSLGFDNGLTLSPTGKTLENSNHSSSHPATYGSQSNSEYISGRTVLIIIIGRIMLRV